MKNFIVCVVLLLAINGSIIAQNSLAKLWVTDAVLPVPESVFYDRKAKVLYTSLMDGSSAERDGKGGIGKVGLDGKTIDLQWISGMNAPKGIARHKNMLFVADLTEIVVVDIKQQKIVKKITVEGAKILNDVTVDKKGVVYVSDPKAGKVFKLENNVATIYLEDLKNPNGLKFIDNYLYMLANGVLYKIDKQKNKQTLAEGLDENTDGIEQVKKGEFLVSCWNGVLYYVKENGTNQILIDTRKEEYYSADIGYDAKKKIVYVPSLFKKTITAYSLKNDE